MTFPSKTLAPGSLLLACALFSFGCASSGNHGVESPYPPIESADFGEMNNVSKMGSIWFGAMPCDGDLELAMRRGVQRVIDLSRPSEKGECRMPTVCDRLELEFLSAGIRPEGAPSDESVDLVLGWLTESLALLPESADETAQEQIETLMIDGSGGRSATFLAIYRVKYLGVPLEIALEEARRGGMMPGVPEEFVRTQVERLSTPEAVAVSAEATGS